MGRPFFLNLEVDLFNAVEKEAHASKIIAIDGAFGVGKSFLAQRLSDRFDYPMVGFDAFIRKGYLPYPASLDLDSLGRAIAAAAAQDRPVIVESILLRSVLDSLGIEDAFHVYVKRRYSDETVLLDELFDETQTEEELIARINETSRLAGYADDIPHLEYQLARYHKQRSPHTKADVLYEVCF